LVNYRGRGEVAEQENLDSKTARDLEEEDAVDHWVAEIDKWIRKVDRDMGDGLGKRPAGADPADGADSPKDFVPGPAN
jgi:hypothetical protein